MLAAQRRHDRLIIDAGVGHQHAKGGECRNRPRLERDHRSTLPEPAVDREIDAARVGDGRHPHSPRGLGCGGDAFEKAHPGLAQGLGVGHDVGLRHRDEIGRIEEPADGDLVGDRPAPRLAELTGQHRPFFVAQLHASPLRALRKP
jgi:hypothetical protein